VQICLSPRPGRGLRERRLFLLATARRRLSFSVGRDRYALLGLAFVAYAVIAYPLLGALVGPPIAVWLRAGRAI